MRPREAGQGRGRPAGAANRPGRTIAIEAAIGAARKDQGEIIMATLGAFSAHADGSFSGAIRTLSLNVKSVTIRPADKTGERSPDYRVFAGQVEFGAGWKKTSKDKNEYVSLKLDDPSFAEPMNAALVVIDEAHTLVWSRPQARND
jgi:uncharacterized protein (DUF736 family)